MISGLYHPQLIELVVLLVATGALAGFLAGIFGIGGGAVLAPVLYECFRIAGVPLEARMPLCIGTSLAIIIPILVRHRHPAASPSQTPLMRSAGVSGMSPNAVRYVSGPHSKSGHDEL